MRAERGRKDGRRGFEGREKVIATHPALLKIICTSISLVAVMILGR